MEKVIGNYTKQTDFPLDEETLVALQSNQALIEVLGNIAGDKVIVYGCTLSQDGTQRSRGFIFLRTDDFPNGEILEFEGGSVGSGYFYLQKTAVDVDANGQVYSAAYTRRYLSEGLGAERFEWADVTELTTTKELAARLAQLRSDVDALLATPVGVIQQWAGTVSDDAIPENYVLCDGRQLSTSQYPELVSAILRDSSVFPTFAVASSLVTATRIATTPQWEVQAARKNTRCLLRRCRAIATPTSRQLSATAM